MRVSLSYSAVAGDGSLVVCTALSGASVEGSFAFGSASIPFFDVEEFAVVASLPVTADVAEPLVDTDPDIDDEVDVDVAGDVDVDVDVDVCCCSPASSGSW